MTGRTSDFRADTGLLMVIMIIVIMMMMVIMMMKMKMMIETFVQEISVRERAREEGEGV